MGHAFDDMDAPVASKEEIRILRRIREERKGHDSCRHRKMWIIASGHWFWCYECGAVRQAKPSDKVNGTHPVGPWIKPVGKDGENPSDKLQN